MGQPSTMNEVLDLIDRDELTKLAIDLGSVYGPQAHERTAAEFVLNWLDNNGIECFLQEVSDDRANTVGTIRGSGGGLSLIFNSHLDTNYSPDTDRDPWTVGKLEKRETEVWREDDTIYGMNVVNDRGPMAAFLMAAKAIKNSGVKLKGDLILTSVMGEIDRAPIDEFQGYQYLGEGAGARHLVHHGISADFALVAECTDYEVTWTECGVAWFKITVHGRPVYTPMVEHPQSPKDNLNAIVRMTSIIQALEEWAAGYQEKHRYNFPGGTVIPKANIGAIRGGIPYRLQTSARICSIYLDVRLPPGDGSLIVKEELLEVLKRTGIEADVETYLYRRGWEGKNVDPIVDAVNRAHEQIIGGKPKEVTPSTTSQWRDINVFNEAGIPAVTYGPLVHRHSEMKIDDLVNTSKLYALIALDICSRPKISGTEETPSSG
ncbi:MAG: M20/M25/M40 family metallo-hydrolase [Nitrososphaerales archaeon]